MFRRRKLRRRLELVQAETELPALLDCPVTEELCSAMMDIGRILDGASAAQRTCWWLRHGEGYSLQEDSGVALPKIHATPDELSSGKWAIAKWGALAIIDSARGASEQTRQAIQAISTPVTTTRFRHTGWREIDGSPVYLHAGGAIGQSDSSVEVELDGTFKKYRIENDPAMTTQEALRRTLSVRGVVPLPVTMLMLAAIGRAPLQSLRHLAALIWAYGKTGSLKTTLWAWVQAHFGDFDLEHLPAAFQSTANSIENRLHTVKDAVLVIDDFAPESSNSYDPMRRAALRIVQSYANRSSRGRMTASLNARPDRPPRALAVVTAEEPLESHESRVARLILMKHERESVNLALLTKLQSEQHLLPVTTWRYIEWLRQRYEGLPQLLAEKHRIHLAKFAATEHLRTPVAMAELMVGLDMLIEFAVDVCVLSQTEGNNYLDSATEVFQAMALGQSARVREADPVRRFFEVLDSLLAQGELALSDNLGDGLGTGGRIEEIGWRDESRVYLVPDATYRAVVSALRSSGEAYPLRKRALAERMRDHGLLLDTDGSRCTGRKSLGGSRKHVWIMNIAIVEEAEPTTEGTEMRANLPEK
ncbi:MAG: hypothetical protein GY811_19875 [Myxococcales bacterium]|nr:hypothetical protein [Myxococcales bacterium]